MISFASIRMGFQLYSIRDISTTLTDGLQQIKYIGTFDLNSYQLMKQEVLMLQIPFQSQRLL